MAAHHSTMPTTTRNYIYCMCSLCVSSLKMVEIQFEDGIFLFFFHDTQNNTHKPMSNTIIHVHGRRPCTTKSCDISWYHKIVRATKLQANCAIGLFLLIIFVLHTNIYWSIIHSWVNCLCAFCLGIFMICITNQSSWITTENAPPMRRPTFAHPYRNRSRYTPFVASLPTRPRDRRMLLNGVEPC